MSASAEGPQTLREAGSAEPRTAGPRPVPAAFEWRGPFESARHASAEWLSHLIVVAGLLSGFHAIEAVLNFLGQYVLPLPPLTSLFDAGDAGLIIGFLVYGVYCVMNAYGVEPAAGLDGVAGAGEHGKIVSGVRFALRPAPATFTIGSFAGRLADHLFVYTVILVASVYICLFVFAPLPVTVGSIGVLLLIGITSVAMFAPPGSLWDRLKWLFEHRIAAGSFVVALAVLLVIEEILRRSS
jgi:hypothetical protein